MKLGKRLVAAALVAMFAAGASAAYLSEDVYNTPRLPSAALQTEEGLPRRLVALPADEGVAPDLVALGRVEEDFTRNRATS